MLSLHDLPKAMPDMGWTADPCALIPPVPEEEIPTVDAGLEGVPGHVYAHVLAAKVRAGSLSVDNMDHLVEAANEAEAGREAASRACSQ